MAEYITKVHLPESCARCMTCEHYAPKFIGYNEAKDFLTHIKKCPLDGHDVCPSGSLGMSIERK